MSQESDSPAQGEPGRCPTWNDLADLTTAVLHEFNNSLNSIVLNLAVMEQKGMAAGVLPELKSIRRETALMGMKARRLQEICQMGRPALEPIDFSRLAHKVVEEWQRRLPGMDLHLLCAPQLQRVRATEADLERLLAFLIQAAAACLKDGTGRITISTAAAGGEIEFRVADTGSPLPLGTQAGLFEPFAPGRSGDEDQWLAQCKALVQRLQGSIRAENQPQGGVAVIVRLQAAT